MRHEDLSSKIESLKFAENAYGAVRRAKYLGSPKSSLQGEDNSTATVSIYPFGTIEMPFETSRAIRFSRLDGLINDAICVSQALTASGTMIMQKSPGSNPAARYISQLRAENHHLENRVGALEAELQQFRPYMRTIQRMVDEHQAGTVRAHEIIRNLNSTYHPAGAIERAAERDRDVIVGPPGIEEDEIW